MVNLKYNTCISRFMKHKSGSV